MDKDQGIKDALKRYYLTKMPSHAVLNQLMSMTKDQDKKQFFLWRLLPDWPAPAFSLATVVLLLFLISISIIESKHDRESLSKLALAVSQEIAMNHGKSLGLEFEAVTYADLHLLMDKLNFIPKQPERLQNSSLRLIGGRYCSIQGNLAAQIKLIDRDKKIYTLYETINDKRLSHLPSGEMVVNNVKVIYWQEKGLFFGLAGSE